MNNYPQNTDEAVYMFEVEGVMIGREHDAQDTDGSLCWCQPCIRQSVDGDLVIHRDIGGTEH